VDDATMAADDGGRLRTDLSFTLFLADPESYEGGALVLDGLDGEREVKLPAGGVVVYPTGCCTGAAGDGGRAAGVRRLGCRAWCGEATSASCCSTSGGCGRSLPDGEARLLLDKSIGGLLRLWIAP
jgi:PKHD-type hydroxylase